MHGQAVALTIQGNRLVRMDDDVALQGYGYRGEWAPRRDNSRHGLWTVIVRHKWPMLAILMLALVAGVASILLTAPVYRAQALVHIDPGQSATSGAAVGGQGAAVPGRDAQIATLTDLLTSRTTARHAAARLRLGEDPRVVADLHEGLAIDRPGNSSAIAIKFESEDPLFAARAANAFAETFVEDSFQQRIGSIEQSRAGIDRVLDATKARLERAERAVVDYARSADLLDTSNAANSGGQRQSITTASLVDLNSAYLQAQAAKAQAQQRWQQANATPVMNLPEVLANPAIQNLTRQRAEHEATLQQELQRRQAEHPAVIQARAQLAELDRQIGTIAAGVRASIGNQYRVAAGHEAALAGKVSGLKAASFAEQGKTVRYDILKREAETSRSLYNSLQQRHNQLNIDATETTGPVSLVDRAQVPVEPVRPIAALNMLSLIHI